MLGSGPVPVPFNFDRPERPIVLPTPLPDFATSRGFAVGCGEIDAWLVGATLSPAFEGADTAVFARKCFVTDTDLKDVGFLVMDLVPSFPARLVSVSEPPLVSAADCVPARSSKEGRGDAVPLTVGSLEASEGAAAAGCFCVPSVAGGSFVASLGSGGGFVSGGGALGFVAVVEEVAGWSWLAELVSGAAPADESLVVVALTSMGGVPPIDCASFTTSWVICSAITSRETMVKPW